MNPMAVESCENRYARLRLDVDHTYLSPGGTVSRSTMMLLADTAVYAANLSTMWAVVLSVNTNLNINFLCKPEPHRRLFGESKPMKVGKRLIVGNVIIYSEHDQEPVANATCKYSIPPEPISSQDRC